MLDQRSVQLLPHPKADAAAAGGKCAVSRNRAEAQEWDISQCLVCRKVRISFSSVEDDGAGMSTARLLQVRDALAKMTRRDGKDGAEKVRGEEKTAEEISGSALERTPLAGGLVPEGWEPGSDLA